MTKSRSAVGAKLVELGFEAVMVVFESAPVYRKMIWSGPMLPRSATKCWKPLCGPPVLT